MRFLAAEACGSGSLHDAYGKIIGILMIFTTEANEIVVINILIRPGFAAASGDIIEKGRPARVEFARTFLGLGSG